LPVAEAMASGCAPIVSKCTALTEVAGDAGVTIDPYNVEELAHAMVTLCHNEALRNDLREKAIRRSVRFKWNRAAQSALNVLEQAAA
jgi:glycosyltransferase involved in cell wall biosynthesis